MIYQLETLALSRRQLLKSAGLATLCSLSIPLKSLAQSKLSTSSDQSNSNATNEMKCLNCGSTHVAQNSHSRTGESDRCQACGVSLLNPAHPIFGDER